MGVDKEISLVIQGEEGNSAMEDPHISGMSLVDAQSGGDRNAEAQERMSRPAEWEMGLAATDPTTDFGLASRLNIDVSGEANQVKVSVDLYIYIYM